jgi:hypothetical protein
VAVYGIYVPTARIPTSGLEMECFPSREVTGRCLLGRCDLGASSTWFVRDGNRRTTWPRPVHQWADADETGYMRVFLRRAADPVPGLLDTPDEEWLVNPGGKRGVLVRLDWEHNEAEIARLARDGVRIIPSAAPAPRPPAAPAPVRRPYPPSPARAPRVRQPAAEQAVAVMPPVCGVCFQIRSATAGCGCPGTGAAPVVEIQRPARAGWEACLGCGKAVTAYARCGCS